jgi:prepilin-type N-terminal cleavage/methylation domain-containing protein
MKTNNKGFTLIELLVVITIISILATISIPQFAKYRVRAFNAVAISDLRNAKTELEGYYLDPQRYSYPIKATICYSTDTNGCLEGVNEFDFKFSNKDQHAYQSDSSGQYYVLATKHLNGDSVYGSGSGVSRVYMSRNSKGATDWRGVDIKTSLGDIGMPDVDNATDKGFNAEGWELM